MFHLGVFLFLLTAPRSTASLLCYTCNGIDSLDRCQTITECGSRKSCFTRSQTIGQNRTFTMGCTDNQNCGKIPVYDTMSGKVSNELPIEQCYECCGGDKCNNLLCKHKTPPPCVDTEENCAYWNEKYDICEDIHESKHICRKFCKLCSLVDGNWAGWSSWSSCDVTCDYGKHTRIRTCTNPAPAYQGLNCKGNSTDTKPCVRPLCPVHGGWTDWSDWGTCPVTCDIGIQKRHRACTNPSPLRYGDHCFGDAMDVKICRQGPCEDMASNTTVAFNAYHVADKKPTRGRAIVFSTVLINEGVSYNSSTGMFVAPRNGTYIFNAQICNTGHSHFDFHIMVESVSYASAYGYGYSGCECTFTQAVTKLERNQKVLVKASRYYLSLCQSYDQRNYFSGFLVHD